MARPLETRKLRQPDLGKCEKTGKVKFRSSVDAQIALCNTKTSDDPWRKEIRAYKCPFCRRWHLTKQEKTVA